MNEPAMTSDNAMTRLAIQGELSIFTAADLRQQLLDAIQAGQEVEVDLSQVSEIDSAGMQLMVAAKREASGRNQLLHFTGHSQAVFEALELCNLSGHLGDPLLIHSEK
jgi:anti-sigma B factor antagonist